MSTTLRERWRAIPGYESCYEISSIGRVRSMRSGRILRTWEVPNGYQHINLTKNGVTAQRAVHRLALETFVGPCPAGMEAAHINGRKTDNRVANLRWSSHLDNMRDRARHGTVPKGRAHPMAKLSHAQVELIRKQYAQRGSRRYWGADALARKLGVHRSTVYRIVGHVAG